jgi:hypothetical protein
MRRRLRLTLADGSDSEELFVVKAPDSAASQLLELLGVEHA